jgi:hypothetical protein
VLGIIILRGVGLLESRVLNKQDEPPVDDRPQ